MISCIFQLSCKANAANLKWNSIFIWSIRRESVRWSWNNSYETCQCKFVYGPLFFQPSVIANRYSEWHFSVLSLVHIKQMAHSHHTSNILPWLKINGVSSLHVYTVAGNLVRGSRFCSHTLNLSYAHTEHRTLSEINHRMNVDVSHQMDSRGKPTLNWLEFNANYPPQVYLENDKSSLGAEGPHCYNIFFWECTLGTLFFLERLGQILSLAKIIG